MEVSKNDNSDMTFRTQQKKQQALSSQGDDCETGNDTKYSKPKEKSKTKDLTLNPHKQWVQQQTNNE